MKENEEKNEHSQNREKEKENVKESRGMHVLIGFTILTMIVAVHGQVLP